ncbi:MAG: glycosyltransferase [Gammaproteobacteria bacterium]
MKIAVLSADYPPTTAMPGSPRLANHCAVLATEHQLTLGLLSETRERREQYEADASIRKVFPHIQTFVPPQVAPASWKRIYRKQLHRVFMTPSFSQRFLHPEEFQAMQHFVTHLVNEFRADALLVDGVSLVECVPHHLNGKLVVDFCDCISELRRQQAQREKALARKIALYAEMYSVRRAERAALARSALAVAISGIDAQGLTALASNRPVLVVPNGVDYQYFSPIARSSVPTKHLVFTGIMDYSPNADAAVFFAREVLPQIRVREPRAEFWIVGAFPAPEVQALSILPGVHVTDAVPDVRPYLWQSAVFVSPLRFGTGVKNKLLAAMSAGVPIVATRSSISGIDIAANVHYLAANTSEEFAAQVLRLLTDRELSRSLCHHARTTVERYYSWDRQAVPLIKALSSLSAR